MLTKEEMLEFCKNGLIPASHIMIHDNENIHLACSLFKVELLPQCDLYVVFKIPMLRNQSSNCVEKCYEIFEIVTVSNIFAMSYHSLK